MPISARHTPSRQSMWGFSATPIPAACASAMAASTSASLGLLDVAWIAVALTELSTYHVHMISTTRIFVSAMAAIARVDVGDEYSPRLYEVKTKPAMGDDEVTGSGWEGTEDTRWCSKRRLVKQMKLGAITAERAAYPYE